MIRFPYGDKTYQPQRDTHNRDTDENFYDNIGDHSPQNEKAQYGNRRSFQLCFLESVFCILGQFLEHEAADSLEYI